MLELLDPDGDPFYVEASRIIALATVKAIDFGDEPRAFTEIRLDNGERYRCISPIREVAADFDRLVKGNPSQSG